MLPEQFIYIGIFINIVALIWYLKTIFLGNTKPNLISWFLWTLAPLTGFFLQVKAGAGLLSSGTFFAGFGSLLVLLVFLFKKNSYWQVSLFDIFCGFLAIISLVFYFITHNFGISILFALLSDAFAYIPTLKKTWNFPETESSSTFLGGFLNSVVTLLVIKNWSFAIYSFPIYLFLSNLLEIYFIYRKKIASMIR